jgi:hypothetical protein
LYYCNEDFRIAALRIYEMIRSDLEEGLLDDPPEQQRLVTLPLFKTSSKRIRDFRMLDLLSPGAPLSRRDVRPQTSNIMLFSRVQEILSRAPNDCAINIDETNWGPMAEGIWTWEVTESESVSCAVDNNEKEGIAQRVGVDTARTKLPLTVIGKGKMPRCVAVFNLPPEIWDVTSQIGCTMIDVMRYYLTLVQEQLYPIGPLVALLNMCSAHRAAVTQTAVESLGIQFVFIPPGCTNTIQPLDVAFSELSRPMRASYIVFGIMKSMARK